MGLGARLLAATGPVRRRGRLAGDRCWNVFWGAWFNNHAPMGWCSRRSDRTEAKRAVSALYLNWALGPICWRQLIGSFRSVNQTATGSERAAPALPDLQSSPSAGADLPHSQPLWRALSVTARTRRDFRQRRIATFSQSWSRARCFWSESGFPAGEVSDSSFVLGNGGQHGWHPFRKIWADVERDTNLVRNVGELRERIVEFDDADRWGCSRNCREVHAGFGWPPAWVNKRDISPSHWPGSVRQRRGPPPAFNRRSKTDAGLTSMLSVCARFVGLREYLSNAISRGQRIVGLFLQRSISRELRGALLTQFNPIYQASVSIPTLPFARHRVVLAGFAQIGNIPIQRHAPVVVFTDVFTLL